MGCVMSAEEKAQQQISRKIDDDLASEMAHRKNEIKLLLLGKGWERGGSAAEQPLGYTAKIEPERSCCIRCFYSKLIPQVMLGPKSMHFCIANH